MTSECQKYLAADTLFPITTQPQLTSGNHTQQSSSFRSGRVRRSVPGQRGVPLQATVRSKNRAQRRNARLVHTTPCSRQQHHTNCKNTPVLPYARSIRAQVSGNRNASPIDWARAGTQRIAHARDNPYSSAAPSSCTMVTTVARNQSQCAP